MDTSANRPVVVGVDGSKQRSAPRFGLVGRGRGPWQPLLHEGISTLSKTLRKPTKMVGTDIRSKGRIVMGWSRP